MDDSMTCLAASAPRRRTTMRWRPALSMLALVLVAPLLVVLTASTATAAFPGGNGTVVFVSERDGNPEIYRMDADGGGQVRLTFDPGADLVPALSSDGSTIAYRCLRGGTSEICSMRIDGTHATQLTALGGATDPAWSPDGTKIVFVWSAQLYVMNADGSGLTQLVTPSDASEPAWSPDGQRIAYRDVRFVPSSGRNNHDIWTIGPDGTGLTQLTTSPGNDGSPNWSPDGRRIVFASDRNMGADLWVMNSDGTDQVMLPQHGVDTSPAFSPDGQKIIYEGQDGGPADVYSVNADGSGAPVQLTSAAGRDGDPDWGVASGPSDADGDGVGDALDQCPGTPAGEPVDANGCAAQSIDFPALTDRIIGEPPFLISGVVGGRSGNPVTFTAAGPCGVVAGTVTLSGVGTCSVTADQAGGGGYLPAPSVTRSFAIRYGQQVLSHAVSAARGGIVTVVLRLTDAGGRNLSSATIPVQAIAIDGGPLGRVFTSDGATNFRFSPLLRSYAFSAFLRTGLNRGEHTLTFTAGRDPRPYSLMFWAQ